ncbi:hypothetical protein HYALB_00007634 [Hymenoscyphus albidus]|uniref:Uncharacterized protein n=1 Tax=Hymenoscyphus albidus TaxID=595503 RepID=A0A9N9Q512_9HELO|nr:hypothetical protein HYALB_00007634 [Hymenoscyphus albidus]
MSAPQQIANITVNIFLSTLHHNRNNLDGILAPDQTFRFGNGEIRWSLVNNEPHVHITLDCTGGVCWTFNWSPRYGQRILEPRPRLGPEDGLILAVHMENMAQDDILYLSQTQTPSGGIKDATLRVSGYQIKFVKSDVPLLY